MSKKFYTNYANIGENIFIRGYEDGKFFSERILIEPTLYTKTTEKSPITSIFGDPLKPITLNSRKESRALIDSYKGTDFPVFGNLNFGNQYLIENPSLCEYDSSQISIAMFDIEVDSLDGTFPYPHIAKDPVVAITLHESKSDKYVTLGFGPDKWSKSKSVLPKELLDRLTYVHCDSETDLLNRFLAIISRLNPDILSGWNSSNYDVVYIYNRLKNLGMNPKRLSPWDRCTIREFTGKFGKTNWAVNISGISNIDYLDLYKKQNPPKASYKLDNIAEEELGKKKIEYEGSLFTLYKDDYQKFIDYNITDVILMVEMEKKNNLFESIYGVAYRSKSTFDDTFGVIKVWENLIADTLWQKNKIPPQSRPGKYVGPSIAGGFVKKPIPGRYKWVVSFDYNSLYPSLIQQYNISPETISGQQLPVSVDSLLEKNVDISGQIKETECMAASGYVFDTQKEGILPQLMRELYEERVEMKKKMLVEKQKAADGDEKAANMAKFYDVQQHTAKILMNSGYGALAANSFIYFDNRLAESITLSGQLAIKWLEKILNEYMNTVCKTKDADYVIAIDTDSCYLDVDQLVEHFLKDATLKNKIDGIDMFASKKIEKAVQDSLDDLKEYTQGRLQRLVAGRENIAESAIWTAKKRYCMLVHDSEGIRYKEPKLKIMGLEAIKGDTPVLAKKHMHKIINLILTSDEQTCQNYIKNVKTEFVNCDDISQISFPKAINGINKYRDLKSDSWSKKGCPVQTHGAITYNELLNRSKLFHEEKILDGSRAYWIYLKQPNTLHNSHCIAHTGKIPKELKADRYIDRLTQYEKGFEKSIGTLMQLSGWTLEKKQTLSGLFVK